MSSHHTLPKLSTLEASTTDKSISPNLRESPVKPVINKPLTSTTHQYFWCLVIGTAVCSCWHAAQKKKMNLMFPRYNCSTLWQASPTLVRTILNIPLSLLNTHPKVWTWLSVLSTPRRARVYASQHKIPWTMWVIRTSHSSSTSEQKLVLAWQVTESKITGLISVWFWMKRCQCFRTFYFSYS